MTMAEVAHMLGHRSVAITEKYYARFSQDHMQEKVNRFTPRLRPAAPQSDPNDAAKVIRLPAWEGVLEPHTAMWAFPSPTSCSPLASFYLRSRTRRIPLTLVGDCVRLSKIRAVSR
jgi:hypothetical protein